MRTIAVTGTASGLGAALQRRLEGEGCRVVGVDRHQAEIVADLGSPEGRQRAVEGVRAACDGRLDGLVSCAGLAPFDEPDGIIRVNYFGAVHVLDELRDALERGEAPAAVAISSIGAAISRGMSDELIAACHAGDEKRARELVVGLDGTTTYSNAKRALAQAVRRRAAEWGARRIRLNAVGPGKMDTPMLDGLLARDEHGPGVRALPVPLGRVGPADEIAAAVVFLLGPDASYVHGQLLYVDGGVDALLRSDLV